MLGEVMAETKGKHSQLLRERRKLLRTVTKAWCRASITPIRPGYWHDTAHPAGPLAERGCLAFLDFGQASLRLRQD